MTPAREGQFVPNEPTWEMQIAGRDAILAEDEDLDLSTDDARACYLAMLAKADHSPLHAAAPEMFKALKAVLEWDDRRNYLMPYRVRDQLHAALAKASGSEGGRHG